MKMALKIWVFLGLLVIKIVSALGNLLTNVLSYVLGLLLVVIAGCAIYCIVHAMWMSLAFLVAMGLTAILAIFLLVWTVVKVETVRMYLREFVKS